MRVPPEEDPLSLLASPLSAVHVEDNCADEDYVHKTTNTAPPHSGTPHSTRAFFDRFVHEAKAASEQKRKSVVDEILWQAKAEEQESPRGREEAQEVQEALNTSLLPELEDHTSTLSSRSPSHRPKDDTSPSPSREPRSASHSPSSRSSLSPKLSPPTLAPPLLVTTEPDIPPPERQSRHRRWPTWAPSSPSPSSSPSWSSSLGTKPKHVQTLSPSAAHHTPSSNTSSSSPSPRVHTRAGSSAAISITHDTPFASHVFPAPISGAPAFMAERYDWDRGFSNELMREMEEVQVRQAGGSMDWEWEREREEERKGRRESVVRRIRSKIEEKMGGGSRRTRSVSSRRDQDKENEGVGVGAGAGVGEFMEKRSGSVTLEGRKEGTVPVLDVRLVDMLRPHLPALDRLPRTWHLVYSLDQHGISLNTLYALCEAHTQARVQAQAKLGTSFRAHVSAAGSMSGSGSGFSPVGILGRPGMVLVIKDAGDTLFGVWMEEGIRQSRGKGYYGTGDAFMWRCRARDAGEESRLSVFKWTGKNKYVALCEPEYVSFGGGDGRYGLYLDETLLDGTSARCATFENEPLCSPGPDKAGAVAFECVGLEVWGVGP